MSLDRSTYVRLEREVRSVAESLLSSIDSEGSQAFAHYLDHGELEMAFEVLCLGAIEGGAQVDAPTGRRLTTIGADLGLEVESVFDPSFWERLLAWTAESDDGASDTAS